MFTSRLKTDWIEPETLIYATWKVLPDGDKVAIAREIVAGFLDRTRCARSCQGVAGAQARGPGPPANLLAGRRGAAGGRTHRRGNGPTGLRMTKL
jgi:hypothetical protein